MILRKIKLISFIYLFSIVWLVSCQLEPVDESASVDFSNSTSDTSKELDMLDSKMGDDDMQELSSNEKEEKEFEEDDKSEETVAGTMNEDEEMPSDEDYLDEENESEELSELMAIAEDKKVEKIKKIVKKEAPSKIIITNNALIKAAQIGTPETIRYLISTGLDINFKNDQGVTALHSAAVNKRWENVKALIKLGASKEISDSKGQTAKQVAELTKHKLTISAFDTDPIRKISSEEE
ncbi:MAG: ankyrin repeat domain-containing protein [Halobacteriovoraceae bacterium]|nr:ankyrin repeat domain-containing protein [Halobacteriovoraceae bacterium]